ncbi:hypothetical protein A2531_06365 [Candidatus Falkowbacteria bacterium RIFOXYD2_FULL_34_120]|uniref:Methyltransferase type 11 domain-containing protein n=1 Tax=Candidatus Falkowbacteria bacterium RIFOXYD2_FULL_34_120 TaxID=1798007 RepID=A0A1F5TRS0_9BACT|nr:MAG: hypothetical protein A2531_06365 [Candidatus Falkowbacteria bacterium RIFOXYD2_FULL_34_120]
MSKIISFTIKILRKMNGLNDRVIIFLKSINNILLKNECRKFKDCLLVNKLKARTMPCSDRSLEYPWIIKNIDITGGRLLDVGSTSCDLFSNILPKKIEIHGINLNPQNPNNKNIKFKYGDIRQTDYENNYFDCITCISVLEHIGVGGRYNSGEDPEGDKKAMQEMRRILKPGGTLLLTIPYGAKDVLPINKLYNKERIKKLYEGYEILEQKFLKFYKKYGLWLEASEEEASKTDMMRDYWYALSFIKAKKHSNI